MTRLALHLAIGARLDGFSDRDLNDRFHSALWLANADLFDSFLNRHGATS